MSLPRNLLHGLRQTRVGIADHLFFSFRSSRSPNCFSVCGRRKLHVAVIGSGPAGFYFTGSLMRQIPDANVHIFERQPLPFGLARFGVAPDHPEVKNCINHFERLVEEKRSQLEFFGNVRIGTDISVGELRDNYDAVICAYGAAGDVKMGVPGEDAANCLSARDFVAWYNGLPEAQNLKVDVSVSHAVVIGQGNVAIDVARILLSPISRLQKTDATAAAIERLKQSKVNKVTIVGRRGPLQVAFTIKELRELVKMGGSVPRFDKSEFPMIEMSNLDIRRLPRPRQRLTKLLLDTARNPPEKTPADQQKQWTLQFLRTPQEVIKDEHGAVKGIRFAKNRLQMNDDLRLVNSARAIVTDEQDTLECHLVFTSIGYKSLPVDGLPFDYKRRVVATNVDGVRVKASTMCYGQGARAAHTFLYLEPSIEDETSSSLSKDTPGVYACGWCARGATGVIATTQFDAASCAKIVVSDITTKKLIPKSPKTNHLEKIQKILKCRQVDWVDWDDWKTLDKKERDLGEASGKPREKMTNVQEILDLVKKYRPK